MSEGIAGESRGITRRGAAKTAITFAAGAAVGAIASKAPEFLKKADNKIVDTVKNITLDDLRNPEGDNFKRLVSASAQEFVDILQPAGIQPKDLVNRLKFHNTQEEYINAIRNAGIIDFSITEGTAHFGIFTRKTGEIQMNTKSLREEANYYSDYPGIIVYRWLVHEWIHSLASEKQNGKYIRSAKDVITDKNNNNPEVWTKYRGGRIITESYEALAFFDESLTDLITKQVVTQSLVKDPTLLGSAVTFINQSSYSEGTSRLGRIAERARLTSKELARYYQTSDVEALFEKIGSVFKQTALTEVIGTQRGARTDEQMKQEKNFLVGKRMAFIVDGKNWDEYSSMLTHLEPTPVPAQK
ncbi:MAG: hypothetical protein Q7S79_01890 [bacterium]|nr:hypothetical protein [bacterium]